MRQRFRAGQPISIVWGGEIRLGRIRQERERGDAKADLVLDVRGMPVPLHLLTREDEGRTWARGWHGQKATALRSAHALADKPQPTLGAAAKKLFSEFGKALVERPEEVAKAIIKAVDIVDILTAPKTGKSP